MKAELLTPVEAAQILKCSRPMVYKIIALGKLPVHRIESLIRIDHADLEAYLREIKTCQQNKRTASEAAPVMSLKVARD